MNRREFIGVAGLAAAFPCGIASAVAHPKPVHSVKWRRWPQTVSWSHTCDPQNFRVTYQTRILNDDFVQVLILPEDLTKEEQRQIETRIDEYNKELEAQNG